jgi:hypothetical protein
MIEASEIRAQVYASQRVPKQTTFGMGLALAQMLLRPGALKKLRVMGPDEPRYVRPPREYEIPAYRAGMKHCTSNEKYLRPTRYCNPREPNVIAMANELGAYELSDWEFAEAAYWFVRTKLVAEMLPFDSVSTTLRRGTGTCYHLTSLWIALCRAAGIKARYKTFNMRLPDEFMSSELEEAQNAARRMIDMGGTPEGEGEACMDGQWVVGHVAMKPEMLARAGLPITRFGEDAIGNTFPLVPGTIKRFESIPLQLGIALKATMSLAPAVMERIDVMAQTVLPIGRKVIEEAGGREAYDQKARERLRLSCPSIEPKKDTALLFDA